MYIIDTLNNVYVMYSNPTLSAITLIENQRLHAVDFLFTYNLPTTEGIVFP